MSRNPAVFLSYASEDVVTAEQIATAVQAVLSPEEQEQLEKLPTQNLAAVEDYFARGGLPTRIRNQPEFDWLWDHPRFATLMAAKEADLARQRERILALEAAGELAPIPPLPEEADRLK